MEAVVQCVPSRQDPRRQEAGWISTQRVIQAEPHRKTIKFVSFELFSLDQHNLEQSFGQTMRRSTFLLFTTTECPCLLGRLIFFSFSSSRSIIFQVGLNRDCSVTHCIVASVHARLAARTVSVFLIERVDVLQVRLLVEQVVQLAYIFNLHLHEPALVLSADRNLLRVLLKHLVNLGHFAIAGHVHIGCRFNTFDSAL